MHRLGSDRNARKVLQNMDPYLSFIREGEKVYYLNKEGRERVQCKKICKKTTQVQHYLMRNEAYMAFGQPSSWKNEVKFGLKDVTTVIADALFQRDGTYHVIEIDHTQKMAKNNGKVEKYRVLMQQINFKLIWVTTTEYRRKQLIRLCEGMDVHIYTINDFK